MQDAVKAKDLPPDNAARLAIYDAICEHSKETGDPGISNDDLFDRVLGRLRVLAPRELHLAGDSAYFGEKVDACIEAGIIIRIPDHEERLLALTGQPPQVRYPDGEIRNYPAGLELARERLDRDNARLRESGFNIRKYITSIADDPSGDAFQLLLASMREHGFMKQFPIVKYDDDSIIDGLARQRAAEILQIDVEHLKYWSDKDRKAAHRRDTPLNRITVAIDSNFGRLRSDVVQAIHERVAEATLRSWQDTAADLALTREWRGSMAVEYTPWFDVERLAFHPGGSPKVQVTEDGKVMVRSLVEAAGLASYKINTQLSDHVPLEKARTRYSGGRKADFARAEDLITGIETMEHERKAANRKIDGEWEQILSWLRENFGSSRN